MRVQIASQTVVTNSPVLVGKHWKDLPCFCDEANERLGGARVICASCMCNETKFPSHFIAYRFKTGYMFFVDIIGPPLVKKTFNPNIKRSPKSREEFMADFYNSEFPLSSNERGDTDER